MAGQRIEECSITLGTGHRTCVFPAFTIIENGNRLADDQWALFRLTDEGKELYDVGADLAAGIMRMTIDGRSAVEEISRHQTEEKATKALNKLPKAERDRTLVRSVRPKAEKV